RRPATGVGGNRRTGRRVERGDGSGAAQSSVSVQDAMRRLRAGRPAHRHRNGEIVVLLDGTAWICALKQGDGCRLAAAVSWSSAVAHFNKRPTVLHQVVADGACPEDADEKTPRRRLIVARNEH